jgi:hypothetical protein
MKWVAALKMLGMFSGMGRGELCRGEGWIGKHFHVKLVDSASPATLIGGKLLRKVVTESDIRV